MSISDADRIAYDNGPKITLANGQTYELHFGYGGLRRIEQRFPNGGLSEFTEKLSEGDGEKVGGKFFSTVFDGLMCGLWKSGVSEQELEANLDSADIAKHAEALGEALALSFPKQSQETPNASSEGQTKSPGEVPGTPRPLTSISPTPSSGT